MELFVILKAMPALFLILIIFVMMFVMGFYMLVEAWEEKQYVGAIMGLITGVAIASIPVIFAIQWFAVTKG